MVGVELHMAAFLTKLIMTVMSHKTDIIASFSQYLVVDSLKR